MCWILRFSVADVGILFGLRRAGWHWRIIFLHFLFAVELNEWDIRRSKHDDNVEAVWKEIEAKSSFISQDDTAYFIADFEFLWRSARRLWDAKNDSGQGFNLNKWHTLACDFRPPRKLLQVLGVILREISDVDFLMSLPFPFLIALVRSIMSLSWTFLIT